MGAHPVLTAERIDAMLSIMAEVCLEAVVGAGQRQKSADDFEAFDRCGRTLQRACRNLRQTVALKQRFDRDEARKAEDGRRLAAAERQDAERRRREAIADKRAVVQAHFNRVLWNEYEQDDALRLCDDVEDRLGDLVDDPDFLDVPVPFLIQRLAREIRLGEEPPDDLPTPGSQDPSPPCGERVGSEDVDPGPADEHPRPGPLHTRARGETPETSASSAETTAISAGASDGSATAGAARPGCEAPAPHPPDPPPDPYVPPWERLSAGMRVPGGSGW